MIEPSSTRPATPEPAPGPASDLTHEPDSGSGRAVTHATEAATPEGVTATETRATRRESERVRLLAPSGKRLYSPRYSPRVAHLGATALRAMYRDMVLTRRFDAEATALQRQGELALWVPSLGQEAAQVGSAHALAPQDFVFPSYREHGVLYARGVDPLDLLSLFRAVDYGGWDPRVHNVHLYTLVIGSHTLHATGYAMGVARDGLVGTGDPAQDTAVVAYFGDGATSQGDVNEALVFAVGEQRATRALLPEQPVGDLRADVPPVPGPAGRPRQGFRGAERARRRQRRAGLLRGDERGARAGTVRGWADLRRGRDLPDGRTHHVRRPDPLPEP